MIKNKNKIFLIGTILLVIAVVFFFIQKNSFSLKDVSTDDSMKENIEVTVPVTSQELFADYYSEAQKILEKMSLEEKVGQLFLVRFNKEVEKQIKDYYPGGYVLYACDFEDKTKEEVTKKLQSLQDESKYPLVFAVDEEGGTVTRVSRYKAFRNEKFKSPQELYHEGGYELLEKTEKEKAELLLSLGIQMNLAPVADVSIDPNDYIYERTLGEDAHTTAEYIEKMVGYANDSALIATLKHFPGYGNNKDTHTGIAIDKRSYEAFLNEDYLPFKKGIEAGVPAILVSHNIITCLDEQYPATLSKKVIAELRQTLNFSGIIVTDDLAMDAVKSYVENNEAATLAINAGNDLIITSDFITMYEEVMENIAKGRISISTVDTAVKRILAWKLAYNIL